MFLSLGTKTLKENRKQDQECLTKLLQGLATHVSYQRNTLLRLAYTVDGPFPFSINQYLKKIVGVFAYGLVVDIDILQSVPRPLVLHFPALSFTIRTFFFLNFCFSKLSASQPYLLTLLLSYHLPTFQPQPCVMNSSPVSVVFHSVVFKPTYKNLSYDRRLT